MSIKTGTQLLAPHGFLMLERDVVYYFLRSGSQREEVYLVQFVLRNVQDCHGKILRSRSTVIPLLISIGRAQFEDAVERQQIVRAEHQHTLPPWLQCLEGINPSHIDRTRSSAKKLHSKRIQERLGHLSHLVANLTSVLASDDPIKAINRHARECNPPQNETRFRLWFFVYVLFGRNPTSLHYSISNIGRWSREQMSTKKRGAPSRYRGKEAGYNVDSEMRKKIYDAYRRYASLGEPLTEIYRRSMATVFGCRAVLDANGMRRYHQPRGEAYPSFDQFTYHVDKLVGAQKRKRIAIGRTRERNELLPSEGKFTERVSNLMEVVESDGYYFKEIPRGFIEGSALPPLCMVRMVDLGSGIIAGIGFAFGAERASAYRAATFCAVIDKVRFCALFGIRIEPSQWPSIGVSPCMVADRGPGSTAQGFARDTEFQPAFKEITPSNSGQSKASVETSHPKNLHNKEATNYMQSNLSPIEMIRREIYRVLKDNDTKDVMERITPDLVNAVRKPSPIGLWNALDSRGRNDAVTMTFDDAVRNYLDQVPVTVRASGVYLLEQRYDSESLRASGLLMRVVSSQSMRMNAYHLDGCVRKIWLEYEGKILELDMQLALRVRDDVTYMSLAELEEWANKKKAIKNEFRIHQHATSSEILDQFKEEVGKEWNSGSRKSGRAKRGSKTAVKEAKEAADVIRGKTRK